MSERDIRTLRCPRCFGPVVLGPGEDCPSDFHKLRPEELHQLGEASAEDIPDDPEDDLTL